MTQIRLRQTQTQSRSLVTLRLARFVPGYGWVTESTYSLWSHNDLVYSHHHRTAVAVWLARICLDLATPLATPAPDPPDPHLVGEAAANRFADPGT